MKVNPIPEGCRSINPYLHVQDPARMIEFLKRAFGGVEQARISGPDGTIAHARVSIGDSVVMMSGPHAPFQAGPALLYHYVADVDTIYKQALAAGAESLYAPTPMFYGDRLACVKDFAGNYWSIASRIEDVSPEEVQKRVDSFSKQATKSPAAAS